jgi:bifunctional DNase/RNase
MMEDKIELTVLGLSQTSAPHNTFALILKEIYGNRSIPIITGVYEAQSIALEIEKAKPPRPLTHDIMKELIDKTELLLTEVLIYDIKDGTYFSKLIFEEDDIEIECRPSDAIAIALKCEAPIFVISDVLEEVGMVTHVTGNPSNVHSDAISPNKQPKTKLEQLQIQLERAIKIEDYETAAKIRDEIKLILDN